MLCSNASITIPMYGLTSTSLEPGQTRFTLVICSCVILVAGRSLDWSRRRTCAQGYVRGVDWRVVHRVLVGSARTLSAMEGGTLHQIVLLTVYVATCRYAYIHGRRTHGMVLTSTHCGRDVRMVIPSWSELLVRELQHHPVRSSQHSAPMNLYRRRPCSVLKGGDTFCLGPGRRFSYLRFVDSRNASESINSHTPRLPNQTTPPAHTPGFAGCSTARSRRAGQREPLRANVDRGGEAPGQHAGHLRGCLDRA